MAELNLFSEKIVITSQNIISSNLVASCIPKASPQMIADHYYIFLSYLNPPATVQLHHFQFSALYILPWAFQPRSRASKEP